MDSIRELLDSVSPEDLERLKSVAQNLMQENGGGSGEKQETHQKGSENAGAGLSAMLGDDMAKTLAAVAGRMHEEDDRTRFLQALRPLLSEERQKKADEAMRFLRLMDMLPLLKGMF